MGEGQSQEDSVAIPVLKGKGCGVLWGFNIVLARHVEGAYYETGSRGLSELLGIYRLQGGFCVTRRYGRLFYRRGDLDS
jgi:hypothetical protein